MHINWDNERCRSWSCQIQLNIMQAFHARTAKSQYIADEFYILFFFFFCTQRYIYIYIYIFNTVIKEEKKREQKGKKKRSRRIR